MSSPRLALVEQAIDALLVAIADDATQEYSYNGRMWKRAEFHSLLDSLHEMRAIYQREEASRRGRVSIGSLQ